MKQILLRVPDDLHRRLADRARQDGRSVNALATELLDLGTDVVEPDRRARLRARAAAAGVAASVEPASVSDAPSRAEAVASTRGWGPVAAHIVSAGRDRL